MLLASDITKAIVDAFKSDSEFNGVEIERGDFVNENVQRCPWIGVYRRSIDYDPETLGDGPDYWTATMTVQIVAQVTNFKGGDAAEDDLETLVKQIIDKIVEDTTLSSNIDMVNNIGVTYSYIAEEEDTIFFQAAIIEMTLEVSTS